jgi:hypothetical protein
MAREHRVLVLDAPSRAALIDPWSCGQEYKDSHASVSFEG